MNFMLWLGWFVWFIIGIFTGAWIVKYNYQKEVKHWRKKLEIANAQKQDALLIAMAIHEKTKDPTKITLTARVEDESNLN